MRICNVMYILGLRSFTVLFSRKNRKDYNRHNGVPERTDSDLQLHLNLKICISVLSCLSAPISSHDSKFSRRKF